MEQDDVFALIMFANKRGWERLFHITFITRVLQFYFFSI
jgi:hypothetical protein